MIISRIIAVPRWLLKEIVISLPLEFSKLRILFYRFHGVSIGANVSIAPNVRFRGKVSIGAGSSIAQNVTITGLESGVQIGANVMIAPNVVIVAFNHGYADTTIPMKFQTNSEEAVVINDDVWIGANATIGKGVTIGKGAIIASNSFVNKDVEDFCIVGGVPAKLLKRRI